MTEATSDAVDRIKKIEFLQDGRMSKGFELLTGGMESRSSEEIEEKKLLNVLAIKAGY